MFTEHMRLKGFLKVSVCLMVMGLIILSGQSILAKGWPYEKVAKGELKGTATIWDWDAQSFWESSLEASGFYKDYPEVKLKIEQIGFFDLHNKLSVGVMAGAGLQVFNLYILDLFCRSSGFTLVFYSYLEQLGYKEYISISS